MKTVLCVALIATFGCGGGGAASAVDPGTTPPPPPTSGNPQSTLSSVMINPATATVPMNGTVHLTATARDQNGTDMTGFAATWTSSDETIARVSAAGIVTGVAAGTATITASITANGTTKTNTAQVTVSAPGAPPPSAPSSATVSTPGASFSPPSVMIAVGGSVTWQFGGATHNVTFGATKPEAGDIPDTSPGTNVSRTFSAPGTYSYQCTRHSGMTGQVTVQATGPSGQFSALMLTPPTAFVTPGGTVQLTATARDGAGAELSGLGTPTFTTSNSAVATVSAAGVVTGVARGTATIIASLTANGVTRADTATVTVGTPAAIVTTTGDVFAPDEVEITPGSTVVWEFSGTYNVTFKDEAPPDGHIPTSSSGTSVARTFAVAGDFDYYCTLHDGMKGRIRVR